MAADTSSPPVQVSPQGGEAAPQAAPAPQAGPGASQIPIPDASKPNPEDLRQQKEDQKKQEEQLGALLVFGAALLPIVGFLLWRFWPRTSDFKPPRSRHRFTTGPADKRRMKRRQNNK